MISKAIKAIRRHSETTTINGTRVVSEGDVLKLQNATPNSSLEYTTTKIGFDRRIDTVVDTKELDKLPFEEGRYFLQSEGRLSYFEEDICLSLLKQTQTPLDFIGTYGSNNMATVGRVDSTGLSSALEKVVSASPDPIEADREKIVGASINPDSVVAANSSWLRRVPTDFNSFLSAHLLNIVPLDYICWMVDGKVEVTKDQEYVRFEAGNFTFTTKYNNEYLDYEKLVPDRHCVCSVVNGEQLIGKLYGLDSRVTLRPTNEYLYIESEQENVRAKIPSVFRGEDIVKVDVDPSNLLSALESIGGSNVRIGFDKPNDGLVIYNHDMEPDRGDLAVVMPLRRA